MCSEMLLFIRVKRRNRNLFKFLYAMHSFLSAYANGFQGFREFADENTKGVCVLNISSICTIPASAGSQRLVKLYVLIFIHMHGPAGGYSISFTCTRVLKFVSHYLVCCVQYIIRTTTYTNTFIPDTHEQLALHLVHHCFIWIHTASSRPASTYKTTLQHNVFEFAG